MNIKTILHPTDFSAHSAAAFELACSLARERGAKLLVLHAGNVAALAFGDQSSPPREASPEAELQRRFREMQEQAGAPTECLLRDGVPAEVINQLAEEQHADLIVMGTHGRGGVSKLLLGSVAAEVTRLARCAVVTVKKSAR